MIVGLLFILFVFVFVLLPVLGELSDESETYIESIIDGFFMFSIIGGSIAITMLVGISMIWAVGTMFIFN